MIYKRKTGVMLTKDKEKYFIVDGNKVFKANEVAARIFQYCNGKDSEQEIIEKLVSRYPDVNREILQHDVQTVINEFCNAMILDAI